MVFYILYCFYVSLSKRLLNTYLTLCNRGVYHCPPVSAGGAWPADMEGEKDQEKPETDAVDCGSNF